MDLGKVEISNMYFQQEILFPFVVFVQNADHDDHIFIALSSIDVEPVQKKFPYYRGVGRPAYERTALFRTLVLQRIMQLPTIEALVRCLKYSPQISCCLRL